MPGKRLCFLAAHPTAAQALQTLVHPPSPWVPVPATALPARLARHPGSWAVVTRFAPGAPPDWAAWAAACRTADPTARILVLVGVLDGRGQAVATACEAAGLDVLPGAQIAPDAVQTWLDTPAGIPVDAPPPAPPIPEPAAPVAAARPEPEAPSEAAAAPLPWEDTPVLVVASGKAGVGKTSTAANLLAAARALGVEPVAGLDLDAPKPDLWYTFQDPDRPQPDLRRLLATVVEPEQDPLTPTDLRLVADWMERLPWAAPGVHLVPGPVRDLTPAVVPAPVADALLDLLRRRHRLVVVDTAWDLGDPGTLRALERASAIVVVSTPDPGAELQTAWYLHQLAQFAAIRAPRRLLVVRRSPTGGGRDPGDLARTLGLPLLGVVPYDARQPLAWDRHQPVAWGQRRGPWTTLLRRLLAVPAPAARGWRFGRRQRLLG
ncbi:MAG: hypothetical protein OWV35_00180 [Firmicutes bacterium]|nr:hypothetical protein [Bacillota bacterium]